MFAYCENLFTNRIDIDGRFSKQYYNPKPKNQTEKSIKNSKLNKKNYSTLSFFSYKTQKGSQIIDLYTSSSIYSYYYGYKYTRQGWIDYIKRNWGAFFAVKKIITGLSEAFSYHESPLVSGVANLINLISSYYVPREVKYIIKQILEPSNYYNGYYVIYLYVVNRFVRLVYAPKKKAYYTYFTISHTYYAY